MPTRTATPYLPPATRYPSLAAADGGLGAGASAGGEAGPASGIKDEVQALLLRWIHDPALFAWEVFRLQLWSKQRLVCRLVAQSAIKPVRLAVASGHKTGKALALDTPIPTPTGWTTMGELRVGDLVLDEHGQPTRVTAVTDVMVGRPCYDVAFSDGTLITADAAHEWWVDEGKGPGALRTTAELHGGLARGACYGVQNPTPVSCPTTGRTWQGRREIWAVTPRPSVPVRCIQVDAPSSLYLASRACIPTHNSKMLAVIAIWFAITRPAGRVIITAPTARQIKETLWREITALYNAATTGPCDDQPEGSLLWRMGLGGLGGKLNKIPDAGLQFPDGSQVIGFSTNSPERMAGTSGEHLIYLIDEASGIDQPIYDAIEGNRAGDASVVMFSNPTRPSGYFFEAFHGRNKFHWHRVTISSEDTPNAVSGKKQIPGLATRDYILEKRVEWGPDYGADPRYQVRILGVFPRTSVNQVVPLALIEEGKGRWYAFAAQELKRPELAHEPGRWKDIIRSPDEQRFVQALWKEKAFGPLFVGVDPAWEGDDLSTIYVRRGTFMFPPRVVKRGTGQAVANAVLEQVREYRHAADERPKVRVDAIGVGVATVERLRESQEIILIEVNSGKEAQRPDEYRNLRAELLFAGARWLANGGGFEPHPELERDLGAPTYTLNGVGQNEVEPKRAIKKRLGRSPDHGDAFSLSVYDAIFQQFRVLSVKQLLSPSNNPEIALRDFGERKRGF